MQSLSLTPQRVIDGAFGGSFFGKSEVERDILQALVLSAHESGQKLEDVELPRGGKWQAAVSWLQSETNIKPERYFNLTWDQGLKPTAELCGFIRGVLYARELERKFEV